MKANQEGGSEFKVQIVLMKFKPIASTVEWYFGENQQAQYTSGLSVHKETRNISNTVNKYIYSIYRTKTFNNQKQKQVDDIFVLRLMQLLYYGFF